MSKTTHRTFINELGNEISIIVADTTYGITMFAVGPSSFVQHTWTPMEAMALRNMLNELCLNAK